ncbi:23S rRNA (pseudouridine(1915)-N(3))-methyltransferase RlmH [Anaerotruncus sp. DFI.9.16]|uniref:23S rRNA (pseudouridine(1915)-N(3))-methyltransferase RlmH n=1 Tax=Anaerotruncus sp. DFI.9.16 TaxID=2965275 RepID=UPI00210DE057|nr:23S rRNA (pseudouridine(1915)-N(3))-methyltransferase RlmH [Anaerotruncus sp. DFI.9.16]
MIAVQVIAVGRLKEAWMRDGCAEYVKRLRLWSRASVVEVDEYRLGENPSPAQIRVCVEKEGERILEKIPKGARVVAMCIEGKTLSSEGLADYLALAAASGAGSLAFVIGGSHGLSDAVKDAASLRLSMSPMTFPHQLARVLLLEQLYRAFSINANAKYHK